MAFLVFAHILWEATKPTIVLTDKSVTGCFQTKATPPALWHACDYVFQLKNQKGTQCCFSQHCSWLSLQAWARHGEDTSEIPGRNPNSTYRGYHLFLRCRWRGTIFLHTSRQPRIRRKNTWLKTTIETKRQAMATNEESSAFKSSVKEITKIDGNHEWNQSNCTYMSRAKCRSCAQKFDTETFRPTTWWSINGDRLTIQNLQGNWWPHNS